MEMQMPVYATTIEDEDEGEWELTLHIEDVKGETVQAWWCDSCGEPIGYWEQHGMQGGSKEGVFIPYFATILTTVKDNPEAYDDDFTGNECLRCVFACLATVRGTVVDLLKEKK